MACAGDRGPGDRAEHPIDQEPRAEAVSILGLCPIVGQKVYLRGVAPESASDSS
jgi:hypothetical protein